MSKAELRNTNPLTWSFLIAFAACCTLFWWLQSLLLYFWLGIDIPFETATIWISIGALATFIAGYITPLPRFNKSATSSEVMDRCEAFSYKATLLLAVPAFLVALRYALYRSTVADYFEGEGISLPEQAVMYIYLFFNLLYISAVADPKKDRKRIILVALLATAPRLLVSFWWRRFYLTQALVPIVLIAVARGWLTFSFKRLLQIALIALFVLFVPALTRGDNVLGEDRQGSPQIVNYFGYMNSLKFFEDNPDLQYPCPPILVSFTAKLIPWSLLHTCTIDVGKDKNIPAILNDILTKNDSGDLMAGTGGNYLLELYLLGGVPAILIGSSLFGFSCRCFVQLIGYRSLYAGIWAECLSRALVAPRGNLGYVFERIPSELLATWLLVVVVWAFAVLRQQRVSPQAM